MAKVAEVVHFNQLNVVSGVRRARCGVLIAVLCSSKHTLDTFCQGMYASTAAARFADV